MKKAIWVLMVMALVGCGDDSGTKGISSQPTEVQAAKFGPGIGVDYYSLMAELQDYFPKMEDAPLNTGESRRMGKSDDRATAALDVVGERGEGVNRASILIFVTSDNPTVNTGNIAVAGMFLRGTVPEWEGRNAWFADTVAELSAKKGDGPREKFAVVGGKRVELSVTPSVGMISLAVKHNSRP